MHQTFSRRPLTTKVLDRSQASLMRDFDGEGGTGKGVFHEFCMIIYCSYASGIV